MGHRIRVVASLVLASGVAALLAPPGSAATPSAAALLRQSLAAARAKPGFTWSEVGATSSVRLSLVTAVGRTSGTQHITIATKSSTGNVTIRLVNGVAYLDGSSFGLKRYMDFTATAANAEQNRWIAIAPSNADFAPVADGLTVASAISQFADTKNAAIGTATKLDGERVQTVICTLFLPGGSGQVFGVHVEIAANSSHLPVSVSFSSGSKRMAVRFSRWGAIPSVVAPTGAVPFQSSWLSDPT